MDDFMVNWFGLDRVDGMYGNPHDEGANADDPRPQHIAQGQQQWQESKAHDALLSPLLDPLEGLSMLNCGKLGLEGRSQLLAQKGGRGAC